jgi:predicted metalloprotease with PDZ domain
LARDALAQMAADLDHRSGRVWRNLQDTADGVPSMQNAPRAWEDYRRPLDYYDEDVLNWLWADVIIRQQTKGAKSLDDFCKLFLWRAQRSAHGEDLHLRRCGERAEPGRSPDPSQ